MALTVGELTGIIDLQDKGFASGLSGAERGLSSLQSSTTSSMSSIESTVTRSLDEIERALADGMDPAEALADLDRLEAELERTLREMADDADSFGDELERAVEEAFRDAEPAAREGGRRVGEEGGRGLGDGADGAARGRAPEIGNGFMSTLKGLGWAAAGAAIGSMLMSGLESAMDAEQAKAKLFAQVGATEEEMGRLGRAAGQVYSAGYGEGLGDVTEAMKSLIQNVDGVRNASEASLGELTKHAMNAATIMDEDVNRVTLAVSNILRNNLAPNAEAAFDVLIKGAQSGVNKSEDLLDTFNEYSTQFREIGLSAQDALGLMSQGLQAGARDADTVADALKEFAIRSKDGSQTSAEAFAAIGLNADQMFRIFAKGGEPAKAALGDVLNRLRDMKDPVEQDAAAVALFGTKAEDLQDALFALDPSTAAASLGEFQGAAQKAGDTLHDTAANKLESFKRSLQTGIVDFLGGTVLPALENFASKLDFSKLTESFSGIGEKVKEIWNSISETFNEWVEENKGTIDEWMTTFEDGFSKIGDVVSSALDIIKTLWDAFGDDILDFLGTLVSTLLGIWNGLWTQIQGIFNVFAGLLTGDWERLKEGLRQIWDGLWKQVESILSGALDLIKQNISRGWEALQQLTGTSWEKVKETIRQKITDAITFVKELPDKVKTALSDAGKWLVQVGRDMIQGLINGVKEMAGKVADAAKEVVGNAVQAAKHALGIASPSRVAAAEIGIPLVEGIAEGVIAKEPALAGTLEGVLDRVKAKGKAKVAKDTKEIIQPFEPGVSEGILAGEIGITGTLEGVIERVKSKGKAKAGDKDTASIGDTLTVGIATGVLSQEGVLTGAVKSVLDRAGKTAKEGVGVLVGELHKQVVSEVAKAAATATDLLAKNFGINLRGSGGGMVEPVLTTQYHIDPSTTTAIPGSATPPVTQQSAPAAPSGGVTVNMPNAVVREEADIYKIGREFAFQMAVGA